jgi:hypothetical protein
MHTLCTPATKQLKFKKMKSENQKQQFEFYLFMAEMVKLLIEEYKHKPTEECFASIDAMILELKEWLIFMMRTS